MNIGNGSSPNGKLDGKKIAYFNYMAFRIGYKIWSTHDQFNMIRTRLPSCSYHMKLVMCWSNCIPYPESHIVKISNMAVNIIDISKTVVAQTMTNWENDVK